MDTQEIERQMEADGLPSTDPVVTDYFAFGGTRKYMLTGGQWIEYRLMNEGGRTRYMNSINREVTIAKGTGDARMKMAGGDERHILLTEAICGWKMISQGQDVPFNDARLQEFLTVADPSLIDKIEKAVREANPWLLGDVTLEDLENQLVDLQRQIEDKKRENEGKGF